MCCPCRQVQSEAVGLHAGWEPVIWVPRDSRLLRLADEGSSSECLLLARFCREQMGRACPLCPGISDVYLFRYCQGVIDLNAEIPDRAFDLGILISARSLLLTLEFFWKSSILEAIWKRTLGECAWSRLSGARFRKNLSFAQGRSACESRRF